MSLRLKGPQVGIIFISGWGTYVWFWEELKEWQVLGTRPFECTYHIFGTQIGRSRLSKVERKGLKEDLKIIYHF